MKYTWRGQGNLIVGSELIPPGDTFEAAEDAFINAASDIAACITVECRDAEVMLDTAIIDELGLSDLFKSQLVDKAFDLGLDYNKRMNRSELIALIESAEE